MLKWVKVIAQAGGMAAGFVYALKIIMLVSRKQSLPTVDDIINL